MPCRPLRARATLQRTYAVPQFIQFAALPVRERLVA